MMSGTINCRLPSAIDFARMRNKMDWGHITVSEAERVLAASLCGITSIVNDEIIGVARVIGDGVINLYIQDVIVSEGYRRQGYGTQMMNALIAHLKSSYPSTCSIGLMAAKGKTSFYTGFGFQKRPSKTTGAGLQSSLSSLHSHLVKGVSTP